jgi:hypothetical protein
MNFQTVTSKGEFPIYSLAASIFLHAVIFITSGIILNLSFNSSRANSGYIEVMTTMSEIAAIPEDKIVENEPVVEEEADILKEQPIPAPVETTQKAAATPVTNISFNSTNTDTSNLKNIYSESTLNVSIKYPAGWAYIDQNRKNKLDGVTFMAASGNIQPPPYVHLAVQDKDIFMESRYKYSIKTWNYIAYYNDPEEMAGQVSQVFYIRTETDEDYSIKFIMNGMDNFKAYQPVFFGMVKTFKFGGGWF